MWLLDPIDGTVHFIRGVPFATTMLALIEEGEVVFSVINNFVTHEVFVAIRGGGATRNGEVIRVSDHALARSFLSFESDTRKEENLRLYQALRARGAMVTNTVNCGFEMSMIASGKWDGRIMRDPFGKVWDFAPGSLLIAEAGGVVTNIGKNSYDYHNLNSLMTNRRIHEELTSGDEALFP
jgi:myo-inositol-1(or 4)-monophosphatase